jgi:hypothetical protein
MQVYRIIFEAKIFDPITFLARSDVMFEKVCLMLGGFY